MALYLEVKFCTSQVSDDEVTVHENTSKLTELIPVTRQGIDDYLRKPFFALLR